MDFVQCCPWKPEIKMLMEELNKDYKVEIYIEKDNVQFTDLYFQTVYVFLSGCLLTNSRDCDIMCHYAVT